MKPVAGFILSVLRKHEVRASEAMVGAGLSFAYAKAGGDPAWYEAGLAFALRAGWLEHGPNDTIRLTPVGFDEMMRA